MSRSDYDPYAPLDEAPVVEEANKAEDVPEGTAKEILEWVGDDPERAERAIAIEKTEKKPRTTLLADLSKVVDNGSKN